MEIRCQIMFIKHRFCKIHELETFGNRKRIEKKLEGCSCPRKGPVVFWIFLPRTIFRSSSRLVRYTDKCMESSKHHCMLSGTATSLQFFSLKSFSFFLFQKFPIHEFFRSDCFMKITWHRISIQTLLFQACLPTRQNGIENRDKAY